MESEWHVISNVSAVTDLVHLLSRKIAQEAKLRDSLVKCMPLISTWRDPDARIPLENDDVSLVL